jgi:hypothetical protein
MEQCWCATLNRDALRCWRLLEGFYLQKVSFLKKSEGFFNCCTWLHVYPLLLYVAPMLHVVVHVVAYILLYPSFSRGCMCTNIA